MITARPGVPKVEASWLVVAGRTAVVPFWRVAVCTLGRVVLPQGRDGPGGGVGRVARSPTRHGPAVTHGFAVCVLRVPCAHSLLSAFVILGGKSRHPHLTTEEAGVESSDNVPKAIRLLRVTAEC